VPTFLVERYLPGVERHALTTAVRRVSSAAAAMSEQGVCVRYLGSTFVPEEEYCACRFEAPSIEAVREANRRAGLSFWRVVGASFFC